MYSRFLYWMATGKRDVSDLQCPFKLVYKEHVERFVPRGSLRWAGDIELAILLARKKVQINTWAVTFIHKSGSKIRKSSIVHMAWETLITTLKYMFKKIDESTLHTEEAQSL